MNLCLRAASVDADPFVGALVRSIPIGLLGWSMVVWGRLRGGSSWPGARVVLPLALVGLLFNVSGNASFQLALAWGGLSVTVPVSQGAVLWGGALTGWWLMRESLTRWSALGLLALVAALPLLTLGAARPAGDALVWVAALAAMVAGFSYGGGNALLRRTVVTTGLSQGVALASVATVGLVSLLTILLARVVMESVPLPDGRTLGWLLVGGVFNAIALGSLSRALSLLAVARVNALSALQTAISAAGGALIFAEPITGALLVGLGLSLAGTLLAQHRRRPTSLPPPTPEASETPPTSQPSG